MYYYELLMNFQHIKIFEFTQGKMLLCMSNMQWGNIFTSAKTWEDIGIHRSLFFELEYWKSLHVRHILDVMHIEKNVCDSIVGKLVGVPR